MPHLYYHLVVLYENGIVLTFNLKPLQMPNGENLKMLRTLKGIPQKAMAKKMGISQAAVSKIEHSKNVRIITSEKYLQVLNYSGEELEQLKELLSPLPINKMRALALAFLIASIPSQRH